MNTPMAPRTTGTSRDVAGSAILRLRDVHKTYTVGANRLHVLKGIDLDIGAGELVADHGRLRLRQVHAPQRPRPARRLRRGRVPPRRPARCSGLSETKAAVLRGALHRLRLPVLQPDRLQDRRRERRAAALLPGRAAPRAQRARRGDARARRPARLGRAPAARALRRPAAARRDRPRADRQAQGHPRRRAHRRPRFADLARGHGGAAHRSTARASPSSSSPTSTTSPP